MYFYASTDVPTHIKYMPTKFFYGQEQNSLKPKDIFQTSAFYVLPQHFTFSRLLPRNCTDTWESPTREVTTRECLHPDSPVSTAL